MTAATINSFFSKLGMKTLSINNKSTDSCFFHNLMGQADLDKEHSDQEFHYTNPKTSFYLCKKYQPSVEFQKLPRLLIKRLAYRKENRTDQWGRVVYNDIETKNIDQVATEYHCLTLLKGSHRAIQMEAFLHENTELKEDKRFFYNNLKLPDRRSKGIRNVCFVLEEMSEGSLREQLEKVNRDKEPFSEEKIVEYACQFAQGLLQLQSKGIIHRDLRPDNVLIHNGQIKFADFDSAFIKGYSNYKNIKNGVDMKETTPVEIMLLIAQSEQHLKTLSSEELYARQEKADIYFLGINIYSMVFSQMFESFNGGQVLKNLINIKKRSGFNGRLLDLMARCLEKDVHVRISMNEVIKVLSEIQRQFYFKSSTYKRTYLGAQPLNLLSFSSNQTQDRINYELSSSESDNINSRKQMDEVITEAIRKGTLERNTRLFEHYFKKSIEEIPVEQIWGETARSKILKANQEALLEKVQRFLERLQIKTYYYELAYRILCEVNLWQVRSSLHFQNLRLHIELFSNQLVVILTFLYNTLLKCSFTSDPNFIEANPTYQLRRIFQNIRVIHSRWQFFAGRSKLQTEASQMKKKMKEKLQEVKKTVNQGSMKDLQQLEQTFNIAFNGIQIVESLQHTLDSVKDKKYQSHGQRLNFMTEERILLKYLQKVEGVVKKQMIQTIISLILAYQKIKVQPWGYRCNLKNSIFMLMILEAQNTKTVEKNDLVIIKEELKTMINMNLGWKSEELQAFFNNYTAVHTQEVLQGLCQLQSQAIILSEKSQPSPKEDFCIQINAPEKQQVLKTSEKASLHNCSSQMKESTSNFLNKSEVPSDKVVEVSQQLDQVNVRQTFEFVLITTNIEDLPIIQSRERSLGGKETV